MSLNTTSTSTTKTNQFTLVSDHPKTTIFTIALLAALVVSSIFLKISLDINNHDMVLVYGAIACTSIAGLITMTVACLTTLRKKVTDISIVDAATTNIEEASNPVSLPATNPVSNPASLDDVISSTTNRVPLSNESLANNRIPSINSIKQDHAAAQALQQQFDEEAALTKTVTASKTTPISSPPSSELLQRDREYATREQQRMYDEALNVPRPVPVFANRNISRRNAEHATAMISGTISRPTSNPAERPTSSSTTSTSSRSSYRPMQRVTPQLTSGAQNSQINFDEEFARQNQLLNNHRARVENIAPHPTSRIPSEIMSRIGSRMAPVKRSNPSSRTHSEGTNLNELSDAELKMALEQGLIHEVNGIPTLVGMPTMPDHTRRIHSGVPEIPNYIPMRGLGPSLTSSGNINNTTTSTASSATNALADITVPILPIVIPSSSSESSSTKDSSTPSSATLASTPSSIASVLAPIIPPINSQITPHVELSLATTIVPDASTISSSSSETIASSNSSSAIDPKVMAFEAEYRQKISEGTKSFGDWINTQIAKISSLTKEELMVLTSVFVDGSTIMFGWAQHYEDYRKLGASHYSTLAARLSVRMKNLGIDPVNIEKFFGQTNKANDTCITALKKNNNARVNVERLIDTALSAR